MRNSFSNYWLIARTLYTGTPSGRMVLSTFLPILAMTQIATFIFWWAYGEISLSAWLAVNSGFIVLAGFFWVGSVFLVSKDYLLSSHLSLVPNIGKTFAIIVNTPIFLFGCFCIGLNNWQPEDEAWKSFQTFMSTIPYILMVWVPIKTFFQYMEIGQRALVMVALVITAVSLIVFSIHGIYVALAVILADGFIIAFFYDHLFRGKSASKTSIKDCFNLSHHFQKPLRQIYLVGSDYVIANNRSGLASVLTGALVIVIVNLVFLWKVFNSSVETILFFRDVYFFYAILILGFFIGAQHKWRNNWIYAYESRRALGQLIVKHQLWWFSGMLLVYTAIHSCLSLLSNQSFFDAIKDWSGAALQFTCAYVVIVSSMVRAIWLESRFFDNWLGTLTLGIVVIYFFGATWIGKVTGVGDGLLHFVSIAIAVAASRYVYRHWPNCNLAKRGQLFVNY